MLAPVFLEGVPGDHASDALVDALDVAGAFPKDLDLQELKAQARQLMGDDALSTNALVQCMAYAAQNALEGCILARFAQRSHGGGELKTSNVRFPCCGSREKPAPLTDAELADAVRAEGSRLRGVHALRIDSSDLMLSRMHALPRTAKYAPFQPRAWFEAGLWQTSIAHAPREPRTALEIDLACASVQRQAPPPRSGEEPEQDECDEEAPLTLDQTSIITTQRVNAAGEALGEAVDFESLDAAVAGLRLLTSKADKSRNFEDPATLAKKRKAVEKAAMSAKASVDARGNLHAIGAKTDVPGGFYWPIDAHARYLLSQARARESAPPD